MNDQSGNKLMYIEQFPPGSIVFFEGEDRRDSCFGFIPFLNERFNTGEYERFLDTFTPTRYPLEELRVPFWFMCEDATWRLWTNGSCNRMKIVGNLFAAEDEVERFMFLFNCFTYRDGSRYYDQFYEWLCTYSDVINGREPASLLCMVGHMPFIKSLEDFRALQALPQT